MFAASPTYNSCVTAPLRPPSGPRRGRYAERSRRECNTHTSAVCYLAYACQSGSSETESEIVREVLNDAKLLQAEACFAYMEHLYNALQLSECDVFYNLGSDVAKLVLYSALRGEAICCVGIEIVDRRHILGEKACARLREVIESPDVSNGSAFPRLKANCCEIVLAVGDILAHDNYRDATVIALSNIGFDTKVSSRLLNTLMRCRALRRIVCCMKLPPHAGLKLVHLASLDGTDLQALHIYDVSAVHSRHRPSCSPLRQGNAIGFVQTTEKMQSELRQPVLLPSCTPNLLCNWSPVSETRLAVLLTVLGELWGEGSAARNVQKTGVFYDLGCGDGRVVVNVCRAFPMCHGVGIDLNPKVIEWAQDRAKKSVVDKRCSFLVGDMKGIDLSDAAAVFLYLPASAVTYVLKHVFPHSGLPSGSLIFSADCPLSKGNASIEPLSVRNFSSEMWQGLYGYTWRGVELVESSKPLRSASPLERDDPVIHPNQEPRVTTPRLSTPRMAQRVRQREETRQRSIDETSTGSDVARSAVWRTEVDRAEVEESLQKLVAGVSPSAVVPPNLRVVRLFPLQGCAADVAPFASPTVSLLEDEISSRCHQEKLMDPLIPNSDLGDYLSCHHSPAAEKMATASRWHRIQRGPTRMPRVGERATEEERQPATADDGEQSSQKSLPRGQLSLKYLNTRQKIRKEEGREVYNFYTRSAQSWLKEITRAALRS